MLLLGIDQHARQLTVSQVSTLSAKILRFFDQLTQRYTELNEA